MLDEKYFFHGFPKQKYDLFLSELESKKLDLIEEKAQLNLEISNLDEKIESCVEITKKRE